MSLKKIFSENLVILDLKSNDKVGCIEELAGLLENQGVITNSKEYVKDVLKRESEFPTDLECGASIPHAKSSSVKNPAVAVGIVREGMVFGSNPDNITKLIFLIAMPKESNNDHIKVLSSITGKLLEDNFVQNIINCNEKSEVIKLLTKDEENISENTKSKDRKFVIGVTGCPVGVAHTYLAAKALKRAAEEMDVDIKVETNGSIGVEDSPTSEEIKKAEAVIVACDKEVNLDRFNNKKVVFASVKEGIDKPKQLIEKGLSNSVEVYKSSNKTEKSTTQKKGKSIAYTALMNGVSFMVPFVVIGGLLIAISLAMGGEPTPAGLVIPEGSIWNDILSIGDVGFKLMVPILAGYIAFAIGDRPALAPGMIGGWIANNGSFYGAEAGTGFIGAIIAGFMVGYFIKWLKTFKVPTSLQPLMPIMVLPILGSLFIGLIFIFIIGAPISVLMENLFAMLENMSSGSMVLLGIVIGLMQGFDMGGPFGKVAFMFSVGLVSQGQYQFMGAQAMAIPVAPLGMALATFVGRKMKIYEEEEIANGKAALAMGLIGISEGAIPFAAADPVAVIPANMIGSAVACTLGFLFGITNTVAHGGPIVILLGVVNKPLLGLLCMAAGTMVTAAITIGVKKYRLNKDKNEEIEAIA